MSRWTALALLALAPATAAAADYGSVTLDGKATPLTSACAFVPRFDTQGWGKPEVTVLLGTAPIDCAAVTGWVQPESGAFEDVVRKNKGALVSLSFQTGMKLGRVSVYGVGYTLGNDTCEGCVATAAWGGAGLKGAVKTGKPLTIAGTTLASFDARFDLAKPAAPAAGEKLAGGGDPGKAYLAYLKAYQDGDYDALVKLRPEGAAEEDWSYYEPAERKSNIKGEEKPRTAKILDAFKVGDRATLIVEIPHPFNPTEKTKAAIGLFFDGGSWRVFEERTDFGGTMLGK
jgi:hypothetical protein